MRKDIKIPEVNHVHVVAIREWDKDFLAQNWIVYLINNTKKTLGTTLMMSRGHDLDRKTTTLRHALNDVAPKTAVKIELLPDEVLGFTNQYLLTFFSDGLLYDRTYIFEPHAISEDRAVELPVVEQEGVKAL